MQMPMSVQRAIDSLREGLGAKENTRVISRERAGPAKLLIVGYLLYIVAGWILLALPWSQASETPLSPLDTLFTSVSAVSTTGLSTVTVGTDFTFLGQIVILALIQVGGLGYMTLSSFAFLSIQHRMNETQERTTKTVFALPGNMSPSFFIRSVVFFTFACELVGVLLLYWLLRAEGVDSPLWSAIFHSVSAFCTAGFALYSNSFEAFAGDVGINVTLSALSIVGAMGFIVVADTVRRLTGRSSHYGFSSKVILRMTAVLIGAGTFLIFLAEPTIASLPAYERLMAAFFQAMTASTTVGFNTVAMGPISNATILVLLVLMIVGASPSGTGGGMKTTSVAALVGLVRSILKGRSNIRFFGRRVHDTQLQLAATTISCYLAVLCIGLFVLFLTEAGKSFDALAFEAVSALGTVGLSLGVTGNLSPIGEMTIIALMVIGRVGILTFGFAVAVPDGEDGDEDDGDDDLVM